MVVEMLADGMVRLADAENFRAFKLQLAAPRADLARVRAQLAELAELPDAETAWVAPEPLRRLSGRAADAVWCAGFAAMIEAVRPHGWIHPTSGAIRAHIVWED